MTVDCLGMFRPRRDPPVARRTEETIFSVRKKGHQRGRFVISNKQCKRCVEQTRRTVDCYQLVLNERLHYSSKVT